MAIVQTDWAAVQTALIAWAEQASGLSAGFRDDWQYVYNEDHILLHISSITSRDLPHVRHYHDAVDDKVVPYTCDLLDMVVEVACVSLDQHAGTLAQQRLAQMLARHRLAADYDDFAEGGLDNLTAVKVGVKSFGPIISVPFEFEGRQLSQATCDVNMSIVNTYYDTDLATDYVKSVKGVTPNFEDNGTVTLD